MAGRPCCCVPCADCGECVSNQREIQATLTNFLNFPDGDYILRCSLVTPCVWEYVVPDANGCSVDLLRLNLQTTQWQFFLIQTSIPLNKASFVLGGLTGQQDCQMTDLNIPIVLATNSCGGVPTANDATVSITAV